MSFSSRKIIRNKFLIELDMRVHWRESQISMSCFIEIDFFDGSRSIKYSLFYFTFDMIRKDYGGGTVCNEALPISIKKKEEVGKNRRLIKRGCNEHHSMIFGNSKLIGGCPSD